MTGRRLTGISLLLLVLATGCTLLPGGDDEINATCNRSMDRVQQLATLRTRVLDRTAAVTEMDPVRTVAVLAHRDEVQRALFGPIAELAVRADARAVAYRRLRGTCREDSTAVPEPCRNAYRQIARLERSADELLVTRLGFWSSQVRIAQRATSGDADGTRQAVDRWGELLTEYETGLARFDRTQIRLQQASASCRAEL